MMRVADNAPTNPQQQTKRQHLQTFSEHQAQHVAPLSTKGDTHADLSRALAHRVGNKGVNANRRQKQSYRGESANQPSAKALLH